MTVEPGGLQSMGSLSVRHDWETSLSLFTFMHWRKKWQPTPVLLPGEAQGQGSLVGCCLWGCTESDTTEATLQQHPFLNNPCGIILYQFSKSSLLPLLFLLSLHTVHCMEHQINLTIFFLVDFLDLLLILCNYNAAMNNLVFRTILNLK